MANYFYSSGPNDTQVRVPYSADDISPYHQRVKRGGSVLLDHSLLHAESVWRGFHTLGLALDEARWSTADREAYAGFHVYAISKGGNKKVEVLHVDPSLHPNLGLLVEQGRAAIRDAQLMRQALFFARPGAPFRVPFLVLTPQRRSIE